MKNPLKIILQFFNNLKAWFVSFGEININSNKIVYNITLAIEEMPNTPAKEDLKRTVQAKCLLDGTELKLRKMLKKKGVS